jgi:hypothetical protein
MGRGAAVGYAGLCYDSSSARWQHEWTSDRLRSPLDRIASTCPARSTLSTRSPLRPQRLRSIGRNVRPTEPEVASRWGHHCCAASPLQPQHSPDDSARSRARHSLVGTRGSHGTSIRTYTAAGAVLPRSPSHPPPLPFPRSPPPTPPQTIPPALGAYGTPTGRSIRAARETGRVLAFRPSLNGAMSRTFLGISR